MPLPAAMLALLVGIAGWYYLFYSQAARQLDQVEDSIANRWRLRLRRINSIVLLLLAVGFYSGFAVESSQHPLAYLMIWSAVCLLVLIAVLLAVIDLRLTARIGRKP